MASTIAMPKKSRSKAPALRRRDGAGHIDPTYAADLLQRGRELVIPSAQPFVDGPTSDDDLAEELAEKAVEAAVTGEDEMTDDLADYVPEEEGGPFVVTSAGAEMIDDVDASNPKGATREPFPRASGRG